jgi:phosphatidylserine decarboxylase
VTTLPSSVELDAIIYNEVPEVSTNSCFSGACVVTWQLQPVTITVLSHRDACLTQLRVVQQGLALHVDRFLYSVTQLLPSSRLARKVDDMFVLVRAMEEADEATMA